MLRRVKPILRFARNYLCSAEARYGVHRSLFGRNAPADNGSPESTMRHLSAAIGWILKAQALQTDGGVTAYIAYPGRKKIAASYPEVTGYIITTMLDYYGLCGERAIYESADRMVDFELRLQMECGAFPGGRVCDPPRESVFNSAQIVNGLLAAYRKMGRDDALQAARRCCDWIVSEQDDDGAWGPRNYLGVKRTYDSKVSESLLDLHQITGHPHLAEAADRNLAWVLTNQADNGWFRNCDNSIKYNQEPRTHAIGYTIQGLLECYAMNGDHDLLAAARRASDPLVDHFAASDHLLECRFDSSWHPTDSSSDVCGSSQLSICWLRLSEITREDRYREAAYKMNRFLKAIQFLDGPKDLRGAVPSAYPFWGREVPFGVTSWAVKYFADALIKEYRNRAETDATKRHEKEASQVC